MITPQNIKAYLNFLVQKKGMQMSPETIDKWGTLPQEKLNDVLSNFYKRSNWLADDIVQLEYDFQELQNPSSTSIIPPPISKIENNIGRITNLLEDPNDTDDIEFEEMPFDESSKNAPISIVPPTTSAPPPVVPPTNTNVPTSPQAPFPQVATPTRPTTQATYHQAPKKSKTVRWLVLLALAAILSVFVAYKYYCFQELGRVYALTNNIAIRDADEESAVQIGRMDIFGSFLNEQNAAENSYSDLKIIENDPSNRYVKVQLQESFADYLFANSAPAFVHRNIITTNKTEFDDYQHIFAAIKNDYNELDKLQAVYRKMIYNAIRTSPDIKGLTLAGTCNVETKLSKKAPLSIGQYIRKDINNNVSGRFVIVQLSNGFYYTIQADKEGNVSKITQTMLSNFGSLSPLQNKGKFKYYDPYNYTYGDFVWKSCDGTMTAKSVVEPFDVFVPEGSAEVGE